MQPRALEGVGTSKAVENCCQKMHWQIVSSRDPAFYSRLFLVQKAPGRLRPVKDMSPLNSYVAVTKFKMDMVSLVLGFMSPLNSYVAVTKFKMEMVSLVLGFEGNCNNFLGFKGCIFPNPSTHTIETLPSICLERNDLSIQGTLSMAHQVLTRVSTLVSTWAYQQGILLLRWLAGHHWFSLLFDDTPSAFLLAV